MYFNIGLKQKMLASFAQIKRKLTQQKNVAQIHAHWSVVIQC